MPVATVHKALTVHEFGSYGCCYSLLSYLRSARRERCSLEWFLDLQQTENPDTADWLFGGGEMGNLIRAFDWSGTALGHLGSWPLSLRLAVSLCLNSRFPMHIWWGPELIYLYNDAHASMLAKRHPSALGRPAQVVWPEVWPLLAPQVEAVMVRGESTWNEQVHVVVERNGFPEDGWFTWSYSPIRDESGAIVGLYDASVEDTPRMLAERDRDRLTALRERQRADEHARTILESITDAFLALDREWRFTYVNPLAEKVLGRRSADLMGKVIWEEFPGSKKSEFESACRSAADERVAASVTSYFSDHDRWYEVHAYPASEGISVYFRDVSESKNAQAALAESEAKFRQLADSMPQIVWAALPDGTLNYYNRRWFEYIDLNADAGDEARWDRYIHPDDLQATYDAWAKAIQSGEPYGVEFRVRRQMDNIAGSLFGRCRFEMSRGRSPAGLAHVLTSTTTNTPKLLCDTAVSRWRLSSRARTSGFGTAHFRSTN